LAAFVLHHRTLSAPEVPGLPVQRREQAPLDAPGSRRT
jgi:hypothetical protein